MSFYKTMRCSVNSLDQHAYQVICRLSVSDLTCELEQSGDELKISFELTKVTLTRGMVVVVVEMKADSEYDRHGT